MSETTAPERDELFRQYRRNGDRSLRNQLVEMHLHLANYQVRRYAGRSGLGEDDLRQVAFLAILRAVERFDPDRGVAFATFAGRTIDGELKRYLRDHGWSVRPPRRSQELYRELRRLEDHLHQEQGRAPTVRELATLAQVSEDQVLEALEAGGAYRSASLEAPSPMTEGTEGASLADRLGGDDARFEQADIRTLLENLLDELPDRDRRIVEMRFFGDMTQPEIAEIVGVSQSYLSRVLRRSLETIRARM